MTLETKRAKEILETLGVKFLPTNGKAVDQAFKALQEKGYTLSEENELLDAQGNKIVTATTTTNTTLPTNNNKTKTKITMKENVLHDGVRYEKGKEYNVEKEVLEVFTNKKFI